MGATQSGELQLAVMANILTARVIPPTDRAFWEKLLTLATTPAEVFDNFSLDILRAIRDRQPPNFASLLKLLCMELHSVVWRHKQSRAMVTAASLHSAHSTQSDPVTSATIAFIAEHRPVLLNCLRLLSRCLAVLSEEPTHPMRAFVTGGVLYGQVEAHEEEKRRREEAAARKAKEKADAEEMARRAKAIQQERDREEAVRREEQRQADRLRIEAEAKKAVDAADAAQAKAKEAKEATAAATVDAGHPPQPFGSGSGVGTPAGGEEFADEEHAPGDPTDEVAIARVLTDDGEVREVDVAVNTEVESARGERGGAPRRRQRPSIAAHHVPAVGARPRRPSAVHWRQTPPSPTSPSSLRRPPALRWPLLPRRRRRLRLLSTRQARRRSSRLPVPTADPHLQRRHRLSPLQMGLQPCSLRTRLRPQLCPPLLLLLPQPPPLPLLPLPLPRLHPSSLRRRPPSRWQQ